MKKSGSVRIIAGQWRSRQLRFPLAKDLRPTPDMVRETLFNWLQGDIDGATCLDLFAGSGAIGFEAASRGAASVTMVESQQAVFRALQKNHELLGSDERVILRCQQADSFLDNHQGTFDLVFLDPPYDGLELDKAIYRLQKHNLLTANALIYLEARTSRKDLPLNENWHIIREKSCGDARALLISVADD